jgi:hypothetical protein
LRCNIISFIETINEVYARSRFSEASKQRFSKCAAVNRSLLRRDDRFASPLAGASRQLATSQRPQSSSASLFIALSKLDWLQLALPPSIATQACGLWDC